MKTLIKSILPVLVVVGCAHKASPFQQEVKAQSESAASPSASSSRQFTKSYSQAGKVFEATDWVKDPKGSAFSRFVRAKSGSQVARSEIIVAPSSRVDIAPTSTTTAREEAKAASSRIEPTVVASDIDSIAKRAAADRAESLSRASAQIITPAVTTTIEKKSTEQPIAVGLEPSITPPLEGPLAQAPVSLEAPKSTTPDLSKATQLAAATLAAETPRFKLAERPQGVTVTKSTQLETGSEQVVSTQEAAPRGLLGKLMSLPTYVVAWSAIVLIVMIFVFAVFLYRLHIDSIIQKRR